MKIYQILLAIFFCFNVIITKANISYESLTPQEKIELRKVRMNAYIKGAIVLGLPVIAGLEIINTAIESHFNLIPAHFLLISLSAMAFEKKAEKEWFENHKKITNQKDKL